MINTEMPADNGRFGVMAAVVPQKRQCKFENLYPAGSSVEAATTPSRWDVVCKRRQRRRESTTSKRRYNLTTQWTMPENDRVTIKC